ncbi:DUF6461 domain-containing protein [Nonomuraea sp. NPDC050540]|uniref:DUF6461 domain-containing protein n=1 Tax=Nonomuraea sp. NPDC050540 TaxID=3364367 RepID=UPI0037BD3782
MPADHLFQLLRSYDPSDVSMQQFYAVWCQGPTAEEAVGLLHGDPDSGAPDDYAGWGPGSDGSDEAEAGLLAGRMGAWTVLIGDHRIAEDDAVLAVTRGEGRALAVSWDFHGECLLKFARSGELLTVLDIYDTDDRSGMDPDALDPYLSGLRFNLDPSDPDEPAAEPAEAFTSALVAVGRVVGQELDKTWLDTTHRCYTMR